MANIANHNKLYKYLWKNLWSRGTQPENPPMESGIIEQGHIGEK